MLERPTLQNRWTCFRNFFCRYLEIDAVNPQNGEKWRKDKKQLTTAKQYDNV